MRLPCRPSQRRRRTIVLQRQIVERAEAYLRAHMDAPVRVARLSRIVGLSERGLRNAFRGVRGMSPKQCMVAARLQGAWHALNEAPSRTATVTAVATAHGFFELGRFAATYKATFGETPSETLRAAAGHLPERDATNERHSYACTR